MLCGALLAGGYLIGKLLTVPAWLPFARYLGAYFFGGLFTLREAIENLRLKKFEIDTLMLVAAAGAAVLGAWAEGALLLFLFSLGHALEHYAMGRAKQAIEALAKLAPRTALVRRDGELREVPVEDLAVGDIVIVKPDLRLPAAGFLIKGVSSVNQAPVTGESIPVDKRPVSDADAARANPDKVNAAHRVFAGTINGNGAIEIEVTRKSSDTTLAKVVKMVSEAETQKSPTQRFTDKFEHIFVPVVLALAVILPFAGLVIDEPFRDTFIAPWRPGRRQPLRACDRNPERGSLRRRAGGARRCAGQGRRSAGKSGIPDRDCLRQDRHADVRNPADHRYRAGSWRDRK